MLKKISALIDRFLPRNYIDSLEAIDLYRARLIIASSLICVAVSIQILFLFIKLSYSPVIIFSVLGIMLTFLFVVLRMPYVKSHLNSYLKFGALFQVFTVAMLIYVSCFSEKGMGFFALFWLAPVFLNIAFYFKTRESLIVAAISYILLALVCWYQYPKLLYPVFHLQSFQVILVVFIFGVIGACYAQSILFVHLNSQLQKELLFKRDQLIESAKFQSLGQMASNLAHDINNPLFSIQGKLHQIRNLLSRDQLDPEKCDQIVENIEQSILKLSQIVKGISTFAREGRGDQMISIRLKEVVEENLSLAIHRIKKSGIDLIIEIDPGIEVICYPSFISQIILNLLNNAIDALENSQIKKIVVEGIVEGEWVVIRIIDSGDGVAEHFKERIFDQFFTTKKHGKGTGLGLSISRGLAEVHEGSIHYYRQNQLTYFEVKLPHFA